MHVGHTTDNGYYGKGIYTSPYVNYARGYGDMNCDKVFVCLSLPGKRWPSEYPQDSGKPCRLGYDSHYNQESYSVFDSAFEWKNKAQNYGTEKIFQAFKKLNYFFNIFFFEFCLIFFLVFLIGFGVKKIIKMMRNTLCFNLFFFIYEIKHIRTYKNLSKHV